MKSWKKTKHFRGIFCFQFNKSKKKVSLVNNINNNHKTTHEQLKINLPGKKKNKDQKKKCIITQGFRSRPLCPSKIKQMFKTFHQLKYFHHF